MILFPGYFKINLTIDKNELEREVYRLFMMIRREKNINKVFDKIEENVIKYFWS